MSKKYHVVHAGIENLTKTSDAVLDAIKVAQQNKLKLICFITGVPGSGKTLAGLNIVHNRKLHDGDLGVFSIRKWPSG